MMMMMMMIIKPAKPSIAKKLFGWSHINPKLCSCDISSLFGDKQIYFYDNNNNDNK